MTSITLDDATAHALAEQAAAAGLTVSEYLRNHLAGVNGQEGLNAVPLEDVDSWLDEISEGLPSLPPLPRDFGREHIYDEHD